MPEQQMRAFSAPGKALLAGGYLVLFPEFNSFVVALSSRMHACVRSLDHPTEEQQHHTIKITSPQFLNGQWEYADSTEVNGKQNPFIESTLDVICNYFKEEQKKKSIEITIYSDPEYHSQENTIPKGNDSKTFLFHKDEITRVAKTGLGSSAGLVTVLTTSLLSQFVPDFQIDTMDSRNLIHNLSQISHCIAQKKIGSGFDVASATFGSIVYRRFKPQVIDELISGDYTNLNQIANENWEFQHEQCKLPPKIRLLMGDVSGGSNTPKLVSKVLNWKATNPDESDTLFAELNAANTKLIESINNLNQLHDTNAKAYDELMNILSKQTSAELLSYRSFSSINSKTILLTDIIDSINTIRSKLRQLTRVTGAEIEPFTQTKLLNHCASSFKGCLGGVVPGAGGYDAICLLCHEDSIPAIMETKLEKVTWLNLHQDNEGVVEEKYTDYIDIN